MMSPKGNYRLSSVAVIALLLFSATYYFNGINWFTAILAEITQSAAALVIFYWLAYRQFIHTRTHEIKVMGDKLERENTLLIAAAIVLAGCFMG